MKILMQLINDTLMKDGKFCKRSLQMFTSFIISVGIGLIIVFKEAVNDSAIYVFWGFISLSSGMAVLNLMDRVKPNQSDKL